MKYKGYPNDCYAEARVTIDGTEITVLSDPISPTRRVFVQGKRRTSVGGEIVTVGLGHNMANVWNDALAELVVRGIRSLEEERAMRLSKTSMHAVPGATVEEIVDDGEPAVEALYRLMPGLSDSGETLQGREPADYESEVQGDWGYED